MKMTKEMKELFIKNVMQDVPKRNFRDEMQSLLQKLAYAHLPAKVKAVYDDKDLRHFVTKAETYASNAGGYFKFHGLDCNFNDDDQIQIRKLDSEAGEQYEARKVLEEKLKVTLASVTTTQKLFEYFPEFEAYIPKEAEKVSMLPIVTDVITTFVSAGWKKPTVANNA